MSRIASIFRSGRKVLIAYITVGYPDIKATEKIATVLSASGCDLIELGIPFSDPLADGATIQKASFHALQNGITPEICLDVARQLSQKVDIPLVFMTYFNPVFSYGLEKFCRACARSGIDGLIIPDLPPEEGVELEAITQKQVLDLIYLLTPTSTEKRVKIVAEQSRGFIYLVSVTGVTGARDSLPVDLAAFVARVRQATTTPLCIGFGISTPEQAGKIAQIADGVIVGSRLIQLMETEDNFVPSVSRFIEGLRRALDKPRPQSTP